MPNGELPNRITLQDGRVVDVVWSSLGTGWDEFGQPVEYYFPSPSLDYLYPDIAIDLLYNIYQVNRRTGETSVIDETIVPQLGIDENDLYQRASYISVAEKLLEQGSLTEGQLSMSDVQSYLAIQSLLVGQRGKGVGWMSSFQQLTADVERIATDPAFANYMRRIGGLGEVTPELQRAMAGAEETTALNLAALIRAKPAGATEQEWLQDILQRLEPYYEQYKGKEMYAGATMQGVIPILTEEYETAQTRLAELEGGAAPAPYYKYSPSQVKVMTPELGFSQRELERARLEELQNITPEMLGVGGGGPGLREKRLERKKEKAKAVTDWDKLVTEARPERIARL